jgi:hypothetical protein
VREAKLERLVAQLHVTGARKVEVEHRLEPRELEPVAGAGEVGEDGAQVLPQHGGQEPSIVEIGAPALQLPHAGIAREAGDDCRNEDRLQRRERRAGRRLPAADRETTESALRIVGREELVHAELGAADVARAVGEQVAEQAIGEPRQPRLARGHAIERDAELVERVVAALVGARCGAVGADGAGREEVGKARVALPRDDECVRQGGAVGERARVRRRSAEDDVAGTADRLARAIGELALRAKPRALGFRVDDVEQRRVLGAGRRRQRDAEYARVGLEDDAAEARVLGRLVSFEGDVADVAESGHQREVVRGVAERRQENAETAVTHLEADRGAWRVAAAEALERQSMAERQRAVEDVEAASSKGPGARAPGVVRMVPFERQHPAGRLARRGRRQRVGGGAAALGIAQVFRRRSRGAGVAPGAVKRIGVRRYERAVGKTEDTREREAGVVPGRDRNDAVTTGCVRADRHAVGAPHREKPPARRGLARVPRAATAMDDAARCEACVQSCEQRLGRTQLSRTERDGRPFGQVAVGGGDDRDRASDGEHDAVRFEVGVHGRTDRSDGLPVRIAERPCRR